MNILQDQIKNEINLRSSRPHIHVEIEPTNICNTVCLHCPHDAISRPYGKMDMETYRSVVDRIVEYTPHRNFEFAGMGEPLLNPLIYEFIEYAFGKAPTSITTNASALTPQNIDRLIKSGLNHLTISFNGEDPAIYELMMGGLNFERAIKNISNAVMLSQGTNTVVGANVSVTRQTQGKLDEIKKFLNEVGIQHIYFSKCHNRGGFLKGDLVCTTPPPPLEPNRCDIFTNTLFVAWTGEILSCCHDLAGNTVLGNLRFDDLETIIDKKTRISSDGVRFDICKDCNDLYRFMNDQPVGGGEIGDWVFDLYVLKDTDTSSSVETETVLGNQTPEYESEITQSEIGSRPETGINSLSRWLFDVYRSEGKEQLLFNRLAKLLEQREEEIEKLSLAYNQEIQMLTSQLDEMVNSKSWKAIEKLRSFRLILFPPGSSRDKWFRSLLKRFSR